MSEIVPQSWLSPVMAMVHSGMAESVVLRPAVVLAAAFAMMAVKTVEEQWEGLMTAAVVGAVPVAADAEE